MSSLYCYINDKKPEYHTSKRYKKNSPYTVIIKIELGILSIMMLIFAFSFFDLSSPVSSLELANNQNDTQVLGISTANTIPSPTIITVTPIIPLSPTSSPEPSPIPLPSKSEDAPTPGKTAKKQSYTIAVYGDSMIDTMGERLEYLEHALTEMYPDVQFKLYNYGAGSQNVEMGLSKWNNSFDYNDRHYPSITELHPDIIILGSFAYNPFTPYDRDRHWLGLTHLIEEAKKVTSNIYLMAEITPLRKNFGKGPNGVNWDEQTAIVHSGRIIEQLENAIGLGSTLHVKLIDVYNASKDNTTLTNPSDGIHPSVAGHEFTANLISQKIELD